MLHDMRLALQSGDARKLASTAHAFVGSLSNFAATEASRCARELEQLARQGRLSECAPVFRSLTEETDKLDSALSAFGD